MARKQSTPSSTSKTPASPPSTKPLVSRPPSTSVSSTGTPTPKSQAPATLSPKSSPQEIISHVWRRYLQDAPSRTFLLDAFMGFLVLVGAVQFLYCVLAGNYPFNAFLSGFSAATGQFVLTASLRMQTSERPPAGATGIGKKTTTKTVDGVTGELIEDSKTVQISSERAFADFIFGSLILHGFCVNFIN